MQFLSNEPQLNEASELCFATFELRMASLFQAYLSNMDLTVEYLSVVPVSLGFSLQVLPAVPMTTRAADDRLLYFTSVP